MIEKDSYSGRLGILVGSSNRLDRINMLEMERIKDRRRHRRICLFPPLLLAPTSGMKWISCMSNSCKERLVGQNGCASHNDCVPSSGKASQARSRSIIVVFSHQIEVNARLTARRKVMFFRKGMLQDWILPILHDGPKVRRWRDSHETDHQSHKRGLPMVGELRCLESSRISLFGDGSDALH